VHLLSDNRDIMDSEDHSAEPNIVNGDAMADAPKRGPSSFLKESVGETVVVRLNSGVDYRGILNCLDGYMNIAMEQTEELVGNVVKNQFGDAFIRGNNVLYITRVQPS